MEQVMPGLDSDEGFQTVLSMIRVLVKYSSHVFSELLEDVKTTKPKNEEEQFLDLLPAKFSYQNFIDLARVCPLLPGLRKSILPSFVKKD